MKAFLANVWVHMPIYISIALIVLNSLIDQNVISVPGSLTILINALLAAAGLGILHVRQQKAL
jgi:hypothetical protein